MFRIESRGLRLLSTLKIYFYIAKAIMQTYVCDFYTLPQMSNLNELNSKDIPGKKCSVFMSNT